MQQIKYRSTRKSERPVYQNHHDFLHQSMTVADLVGGDSNLAYLKASLYFLFIPYIVGFIFTFFLSAMGTFSEFVTVVLRMDMIGYMMLWIMGYEVLTVLFLGWVLLQIYHYSRLGRLQEEERSPRI